MAEIDKIVPLGSESGRRSRNARRASLACTNCKRAKRKCDVLQQGLDADGCGNCRSKGEVCEIRYGEDRRRKRGALVSSDVLTRLSFLEGLLLERNRTGQPSPEQDQIISNGDESHCEEPGSRFLPDQPLPPIDELEPEQMHLQARSPRSFADGQPIEPQTQHQQHIQELQKDLSGSSGLALPSTSLGEPSPNGLSIESTDGQHTEDNSSAILEKVISREGRLGGKRDDQLTYFGSTSMYHLCHEPQTQQGQHPNPSLEPEYDPSNEPEPVVTYLLDLFWTWQASHLQVLDRRLFLADKKSFGAQPARRYDYFSPSLLYAILALASMISSDKGIRYQSRKPGGVVGEVYFEKAKTLFDREMDRPSITTVQTALLLGSRYGALGHLSLGWTYSGISFRMAMELGLNYDCRKALEAQQISQDMAEARKVVFWGCYVQDKLWSAYCGRPSSIMDDNITVELLGEQSPTTQMQIDGQFFPAIVQRNIILLTIECSKILSEVYSQKHATNHPQLQASATTIHNNLLQWHQSLPDSLSWPNQGGHPSSPHVLIMHMQFYFTLILLHRPFINLSEAAASLKHLHQASPDTFGICTLAALNITKLARDYSMFYNLKQIASPAVHFIFVASSIHLISYQISHDESHQILFQGCLSSLFEIAQAYPTGKRAFVVLRDLWHQFQRTQSRTPETLPRASSNSNQGESSSQFATCPSPFGGTQNSDTGAALRYQEGINRSVNFKDAPVLNPAALQADEATAQPPIFYENFDWSVCNSPLDLPPSLNEIDASVFDLSKTGDTHMQSAGGLGNYQAEFGSLPMDLNNIQYAFGGAGTSCVAFDRLYGTPFGLDNYV